MVPKVPQGSPWYPNLCRPSGWTALNPCWSNHWSHQNEAGARYTLTLLDAGSSVTWPFLLVIPQVLSHPKTPMYVIMNLSDMLSWNFGSNLVLPQLCSKLLKSTILTTWPDQHDPTCKTLGVTLSGSPWAINSQHQQEMLFLKNSRNHSWTETMVDKGYNCHDMSDIWSCCDQPVVDVREPQLLILSDMSQIPQAIWDWRKWRKGKSNIGRPSLGSTCSDRTKMGMSISVV